MATYLGSAGLGYLIAWPALFWMVGQSLRNRARREKWFILVLISAALALLAWSVIYITRQPTTQEMERASMIALAVASVFAAVFIMAQRHFQKKNGA
jgi:hydrogenase-4 membrane subunit HyfE